MATRRNQRRRLFGNSDSDATVTIQAFDTIILDEDGNLVADEFTIPINGSDGLHLIVKYNKKYNLMINVMMENRNITQVVVGSETSSGDYKQVIIDIPVITGNVEIYAKATSN